jgi:hypothetical protein
VTSTQACAIPAGFETNDSWGERFNVGSRGEDLKSTMAMRAAIASSIGAALEWIDFTAYGALSATVFGGC